jgi:hypothetical protein
MDRNGRAAAELLHLVARPRAGGLRDSEHRARAARIDAQRAQQVERALHLELARQRGHDAIGVEPASAFLRITIREADPAARTRAEGEQARARVAVGVDHEVVASGTQLARVPEEQPQRRDHAPAAQEVRELRARRHPEPVDLRVTGEQRRGLLLHEPADLRVGQRAAQRVEHRQRVDDVAERREPDDQNAARSRFFAVHGAQAGLGEDQGRDPHASTHSPPTAGPGFASFRVH